MSCYVGKVSCELRDLQLILYLSDRADISTVHNMVSDVTSTLTRNFYFHSYKLCILCSRRNYAVLGKEVFSFDKMF